MAHMANIFDGVCAVLFDMDGTLVETDIDFPLMRREVAALGERYGVPASDIRGLDILAGVDLIVSRLTERGHPEEAVHARQEAYEKLEQIELSHSEDARAIPSAREVLQALRDAGIKVAIVTRNCRAAVLLSLELAGISSDVLLTRDDVPKAKPDPDHLLRALSMLGVPPDEAITIGDHWMDVAAGNAAGTRTIGFLRADRPSDFFDMHEPGLVIRDLAELLGPINRLKE
jgi:phosphoglycolate phosphatase